MSSEKTNTTIIIFYFQINSTISTFEMPSSKGMSDYLHMSKNPRFGLNPGVPAYSKTAGIIYAMYMKLLIWVTIAFSFYCLRSVGSIFTVTRIWFPTGSLKSGGRQQSKKLHVFSQMKNLSTGFSQRSTVFRDRCKAH